MITKANYLGAYKILVWFSDGRQRIIDFEPLFLKFVKEYYTKWSRPSNFKKFIIDNGNIYWGENEDVIFPVSFLYSTRSGITQKEKIVYVI